MKVSFIGLGIMGLPIAKHIQSKGLLYKVYNRTRKKADFFESTDVLIADSPKEAAEGADIVITMVGDSPDVEDVVLGENGVIKGISSNSILMDMSSINPEVSKKIGKKLESIGVSMLDAPVSGGEKGAVEGNLAVMVGGDETVLQEVHQVLRIFCSSIVHVGPLGDGGYAKLANQIIVALELQALAEAFNLAKQAGLDFEQLYQAIRKGLAGSKVLDQKINNLIDETFQPGFKVKLHLKDIKNALQAADSLDVDLPLTKVTKQFMEQMVRDGLGEFDHSALYEHMARKVIKSSN